MLALNDIRNHKQEVILGLQKRNFDRIDLIDKIIELDQKRREIQTTLDAQLARANQLAKEIGPLFKSGQAQKAAPLKEEAAQLKASTKVLQETLQTTSDALWELRTQIPNIPHSSVPAGTSEQDNEVVFEAGTIPKLHDNALPHWDLATQYDLIDFELGSKITGAGFPVYKGKGARLQRALIQFFLDKNTQAGYQEMQVPHLVNADSGFGTGQLPDKEGQMYHAPLDDLYLIPTAEVPLTNLYRGELLQESQLPIALTGYTPCFRREAGSYGAHVRGLNRLHQFDKVEIVRIEKPENALAALDAMVAHVKNILKDLELPYRILRLCGGDIGFTSALTYDFEVFSTAQDRWLEISSVSTFNSFQAERLQLRYKDAQGAKHSVHTLNGSALALPRVMAGILENFQTPEGIVLPKALHPYTGFERID
ncbi:MAG: serine--tRNA ligase [Bacteroidetes bacterium]|nr:serine--tRNA ligase [Bacteroidota bacterium]MDA0937960.1 serine--tRNA ligase [Bacteroidota bacterium]MDA1344010.1 serine--tRNA ligase [Bacteroidota bacterium]